MHLEELQELLEEVGYCGVHIEIPLELMPCIRSRKRTGISQQSIDNVLKNLELLPARPIELCRTMENLELSGAGDVKLASRLIDHDFSNTFYEIESMTRDAPLKNVRMLVSVVLNTKAAYMAQGYLASGGDPYFTFTIPMPNLPGMLSAIRKGIDYKIPPQGELPSPAYSALTQVVRNSPTDPLVQVELGEKTIVKVSDKGWGIQGLDSKPIQPENISKIFYGQSTKGSGLGLQIARRLLYLLGGYIGVSTTYLDQTITYDTQTKKPQVLNNKTIGTQFMLYVPQLQACAA
jgi:hypothetical protein